jgi:hypothetical protein
MPASNILYRILWVQEDERRARIVNPAEEIGGLKWSQNEWKTKIDHLDTHSPSLWQTYYWEMVVKIDVVQTSKRHKESFIFLIRVPSSQMKKNVVR